MENPNLLKLLSKWEVDTKCCDSESCREGKRIQRKKEAQYVYWLIATEKKARTRDSMITISDDYSIM